MYEVKKLENEPTGQPTILLSSTDNVSTCKIKLYGATIVSWTVSGEEKLFLSEKAHLDGSKAIRGGVPLVFPQFGQPDASMPQHGFARNKMWSVADRRTSDNSCEVDLVLRDDESTRNLWPHSFVLIYTVKLSENQLTTELQIVNPSDSSSFSCQALLHTYLRIPKIQDIICAGFSGFDFVDKMNNNTKSTETENSIIIDREVDRIYCAKPDAEMVISIRNRSDQVFFKVESFAESVQLLDGCEFGFDVASKQHIHTDVVLWNAWVEKAKSLADMNDDGYLYYVCVEPGLVTSLTLVRPRSAIKLSQTIQV